MENSEQDINSFIEGAKNIWDAWAGPKNKPAIVEALQLKSRLQDKKMPSKQAIQDRRQSVYQIKRPPSA